jgi:hypothetical protein
MIYWSFEAGEKVAIYIFKLFLASLPILDLLPVDPPSSFVS